MTGTVGWQRVASVHEGVNEDPLDFILLGHLEQRMKMSLIRVHAAIRDQAEQMELTSTGSRVLHAIEQHRMFEELTILDHQLDAGRIHVDHAPGSNVQMSYFTVAHLIVRQTDVLAAGMDQRVGILAQQPVVNRLSGKGDGVSFGFGTVSPAVEDD